MNYLFKSKAAGDVLMLGASGDRLLRTIGKEPAAKGIIEPQYASRAEMEQVGVPGERY